MLSRCTPKTASKRAIQKTVEPAGDLTGNKIEEKITRTAQSKTKHIKFNVEKINKNNKKKKRYISLEKRQQIIDELRLV